MPNSDDDLIDQLAELETKAAAPKSDTNPVAKMQAELETLSQQLRQPAPEDPYSDESGCSAAVEWAAGLARDASQVTVTGVPGELLDSVPVAITKLGHYELQTLLGQGGMGTVYKALHTKLDRVVALKILSASRLKDPQAVTRFEREMRAVGKLQHPNIVTAHDAGEVDGTHYLAMELVHGIDLGGIVQSQGQLPFSIACEMVRQVAIGLEYANEHGLVHRDIKPSNLMLSQPARSDGPVIVKILDLGLALLEDGHFDGAGEITSTGQVMGTVDYMAPEQGTDTHRVDIRADIYSLGATLFKLITGKVPFSNEKFNTTIKKLMAMATQEPTSVLDLRPDCPPELAKLIHQMLSKSPEDRPDSPAAVADALAPFARGADLKSFLEFVQQDSLNKPLIGTNKFVPNTASSAYCETDFAKLPARFEVNADATALRRSLWRWMIALGILAAVVFCGVVITIATDQGKVVVDFPDGMENQIKIKVLRDGKPADAEWKILPSAKETTVRSGPFEIQLPSDIDNEFVVVNPEELRVHRGKTLTFRIQRRPAEKPDHVMNAQTNMPSASPSALAPKPIEILEPPSLEVWIKGREVLTVAQDGSGQFTTIQSALKSLKPGQVIKVLDHGPYRERLGLNAVPADSGLVTDQKTIIELDGWHPNQHGNPLGHIFHSTDGFRISGFHLVFPEDCKDGSGLVIFSPDKFVLENCLLQAPKNSHFEAAVMLNWYESEPIGPGWIRDCMIEGSISVNSTNPHAQAVVQRNFVCGGSHRNLNLCHEFTRLVVRHNVFGGDVTTYDGHVGISKVVDAFEFTNNTSIAVQPCWFCSVLPMRNVFILNNLRSQPGLFICSSGSEVDLRNTSKDWALNHNGYLRPFVQGDFGASKKQLPPKGADDVFGDPQFLSVDPSDPDYLHLAADNPRGTAGAAGNWPSYIGAFPPGPTPEGGDWFSKMRTYWVGPLKGTEKPSDPVPDFAAKPIEFPEPPSLEDWVKEKSELTVSQDGKSQFKTIQSALDALQPGQFVRVLDRGPYRERLDGKDLPEDSGMVTEVGTVIEVPDWLMFWKSPENENFCGHHFNRLDGFRISGFRMTFPANGGLFHQAINTDHCSGIVLENCWIQVPDKALISLTIHKESSSKPECVRDCKIEGKVNGSSGDGQEGSALILRNHFVGNHEGGCLSFVHDWTNIVIRGNLFCGKHNGVSFHLKTLGSLEISNNFFQGEQGIVFYDHLPRSSVTICNNLRTKDGLIFLFGGAESQMAEAARSWQVGHNWYFRGGWDPKYFFPRVPSDILGPAVFLSKIPASGDYLHLPAEDSQVRSGASGPWPDYIGPFLPGPAPREGDWFTRIQQRWPAEKDSTLRKPDPVVVREIKPRKPIDLLEPPSLEEWMKGREILTVAQDGSGQFKTIQSALLALKPGKVVKVLDQGPYRERLRLNPVPADTGLVTDQKTIIEVDEWRDDERNGHFFFATDGFRLSGFRLSFPVDRKGVVGLIAFKPDKFLLENCRIEAPENNQFEATVALNWYDNEPIDPAWIRDCVIDGQFNCSSLNPRAVAVVERNYFITGTNGNIGLALEFDKLVIRHNIFGNNVANVDIEVSGLKTVEALEISNNTSIAVPPCYFHHGSPHRNVSIVNNLRSQPGLFMFISGAESGLPNSLKEWRMDHNGYTRPFAHGEFNWMKKNIPPTASSDVLGDPQFLSVDPTDCDYLHLAVDNPRGKAGAGGDWPTYIGAFPPGPAPEDGDWFSKMRTYWVGPLKRAEKPSEPVPDFAAKPIEIPEPPSLEEWLKGRDIVTVAQDGSGQFKTIQSALDALKPGQVIEVLDQGQYREVLVSHPPDDTGLISRHDAVIEIRGFQPDLLKDDPHHGQIINPLGRFRLHGFHFLANLDEQSNAGMVHAFHTSLKDNTVIENCRFQVRHPTVGGLLVHWLDDAVRRSECVIRDCVFDTSANMSIAGAIVRPRAVLLRNWFRTPDRNDASLQISQSGGTAVVRHNTFSGRQDRAIHLFNNEGAGSIEISNNTILTGKIWALKNPKSSDVTFRNNISNVPIWFETQSPVEALAKIFECWHVGNNRYVTQTKRGKEFPEQKTDLVGDATFLSKDPADRNYLRIPADAPDAISGAGGSWPKYIGALPPGPASRDGDWFSRLQQRWPESVASPAATTQRETLGEAAAGSPIAIHEPPPLEEWMKGREVLTVAQDGSGQFKTIQSALDALKSGQVIEVLDQGPYREVLGAFSPDDTGLISRHNTVIELHGFQRGVPKDDPHHGHIINPLGRFRLHGFHFIANLNEPTHAGMAHTILMGIMDHTVVEYCRFQGGLPQVLGFNVVWRDEGVRNAECLVRDCVFDTSAGMNITGDTVHPRAVIVRNWFRTTPQDAAALIFTGSGGTAIARHNVFGDRQTHPLTLYNTAGAAAIEISNNTILTGKLWVIKNAKSNGVTICNNIFNVPILIETELPATALAKIYESWQVSNNRYVTRPKRGKEFPEQKTDLVGEAAFLSKDLAATNYLHIPADAPDAKSGAGGPWPKYIGALPPGPAPEGGDWFSKMQTKWMEPLK